MLSQRPLLKESDNKSSSKGFDYEGARQAGYSDAEIKAYFSEKEAARYVFVSEDSSPITKP